ncbi:response regulator [Yoonia sp.]|uniref:response regulator n=1 Tax=Yoonia sp. TaxID=2212373 RepID=UPI00358F1EF7
MTSGTVRLVLARGENASIAASDLGPKMPSTVPGSSPTRPQDVEAAMGTAFDLILMDISMPIMDGRAATRAIRESDGASKDTPIVALTANAMPDEQKEFLVDGMTVFLPNPFRARRCVIRGALFAKRGKT